MADKTKWIRNPGPGEFRGKGVWVKTQPEDVYFWHFCQETGYLPTHEGSKPLD